MLRWSDMEMSEEMDDNVTSPAMTNDQNYLCLARHHDAASWTLTGEVHG